MGLRIFVLLQREHGAADYTRGIAFFSTPHNGSGAAVLGKIPLLRPGANIAELAANNPQLRKLNQWFRNNIDPLRIQLLIYCETESTKGF